MTRRMTIATVFLLIASVLLVGCSRSVQVETGERTTCTYGELITDTVKTVEVSADKAAEYRVVTTTVTCERHVKLEDLYAAAQAAILAGDLAAARVSLVEVVTIEPLFKNARQQLDAIDEGSQPTVDGSASKPSASATRTPVTPPAVKPGAGQQPVGPVASLSAWVPESLPGYTATPIVADVYVLTREYIPAAGTPTYALVAVVEQYKSASTAKSAIKSGLASSYPTGGQNLSIGGRSVYFGTDGNRRAIVAWNEGGAVVVIEGSVKSGSPAALKSHLSGLVSAIVK